jgi:hypothetical protein
MSVETVMHVFVLPDALLLTFKYHHQREISTVGQMDRRLWDGQGM